jgi:hypothetical protein
MTQGTGPDAPERALSNAQQLLEHIRGVLRQCEQSLEASIPMRNAQELEQAERDIIAQTDKLAGLLVAYHTQLALNQPALAEEAQQLARDHPKRFKNDGCRPLRLVPDRGQPVEIFASYWRRKGSGANKPNRGMYPQLVLLGIHERRTPLAAAQTALLASAMCSLEEAAQMLRAQGRNVDVKTIRTLTYRYAQRARAATDEQSFEFPEQAAGHRIAVSVDGGRVRIRTDKQGKRTAKGRRRYHTEWREPKLLHIWALDADGRIERRFCPIIDGTLRGPDAVFMLMRYYLRQLNVQQADCVLFIADGARWIWKRFEPLIAELALDPRKVFQLIDFYHVVEHLHAFASLRRGWSSAFRKQWVSKHRRLLLQGQIDKLIAALHSACRGRRNKDLIREKNYFLNNRHRFKYRYARRRHLPIGSGPMESAIRRVVNLRLKGAGIFWHEHNANAMLLLRSYYKAGRWTTLVALVTSAPLEAYS